MTLRDNSGCDYAFYNKNEHGGYEHVGFPLQRLHLYDEYTEYEATAPSCTSNNNNGIIKMRIRPRFNVGTVNATSFNILVTARPKKFKEQ